MCKKKTVPDDAMDEETELQMTAEEERERARVIEDAEAAEAAEAEVAGAWSAGGGLAAGATLVGEGAEQEEAGGFMITASAQPYQAAGGGWSGSAGGRGSGSGPGRLYFIMV